MMASRKGIKALICYVLIFSLFVGFLPGQVLTVQAATDITYKWAQGSTLNEKLEIQSSSSDNSALLYWDLKDTGKYTLEYFLEDKSKMVVTVNKVDGNTVNAFYQVFEYDGTWDDVTESKIGDYQEVDYKTSPLDFQLKNATAPIEDYPTVGTNKALAFKNIKKGQTYAGATFSMSNKVVHFMWDEGSDRFYYESTGIDEGKITPFILSYEEIGGGGKKGPYIKEVITKLEAFNAQPSHYKVVGTSIKAFENSDLNNRPGDHPGMDISFKHPKVFNYTNFTYAVDGTLLKDKQVAANVYVKEYGNPLKSTMESIDMKKDASANPFYDGVKKVYDIRFVKDSTVGGTNGDAYVTWADLEASTLYEIKTYLVSKAGTDEKSYITRDVPYGGVNTLAKTEFMHYKPDAGYGYTYVDFKLKRESTEEAFLEVTPYKGIVKDILKYDVYVSPEPSRLEDGSEVDDERWLTYTHEIGSSPYEGKLYIPVKFTGGTGYHYKMNIYFDGMKDDAKIYTQRVHYATTDAEIVPPPTSTIRSISDVKVLPSESGSIKDDPTSITVDLTWNSPSNVMLKKLLEDGELYYELLINEEPLNGKDDKAFEPIKLFKVFLNAAGEIEVTTVVGGTEKGDDTSYYDLGYNKDNNTFRINDMVIKNNDTDPTKRWLKAYETDYDKIETDPNNFVSAYAVKQEGGKDVEYDNVKKLPNVNFLRLRTIYFRDKNDDGVFEDGASSSLSIAKGMSLSNVSLDVPVPNKFRHENILTGTAKTSFELKWNAVDLSTYINNMLLPVDKEIKDEALFYDVYVSQDKEKLNHLKSITSDADYDFIGTDPKAVMEVDLADPANKAKLEALRKNEVLSFKVPSYLAHYGDVKLNIKGADNNQVYHAVVITRGDINKVGETTIDETRRSNPSDIISFTTLNLVDPIEVMPKVPGEFQVLEELSSSSIKIGWLGNMKEISPDESIGYELLRVDSRTLGDSFSPTTSQEEIISSSEAIQGWRITDVDKNGDYVLEKYNEETKAWDEVKDRLSVNGDKYTFVDTGLVPNKIYYYYLRAVRVEKHATDVIIDRSKPASEWADLTYTSSPLKAPINLTQSFDDIGSYDDPKTQSLIYFDVAIPEDSTVEYEPEIFIFSEDDRDIGGDYINLMGSHSGDFKAKYISKSTNGAPSGYIRYYYLLDELKSGKSYSVKVRVKVKSSDHYSSFSERIVVRTEFDKDDYEHEQLLDYYLEYYNNETAKLYQTLYWSSYDSIKRPEIKFRHYIALDEFASLTSGKYVLDMKEETMSIYLPQQILDLLTEGNIQFVVSHKDMEVTVSPDTLLKSKIDAFEDIADKVAKDSDLRDYYVQLKLKFSDYKYNINGQNPQGQLLRIEANLVASKKDDIQMESLIKKELEQLIASNSRNLQRDLADKLKDGIYDKESLLEVVDDRIDAVKERHKNEVGEILRNSFYKTPTESIYELHDPLDIGLKVKSPGTLVLYQRQGATWKKIKVRKGNNLIYGSTGFTGEYIFAGFSQEELIPVKTKNGKKMNDLISKYDLMDYYTLAELRDLDKDISRYNMYGILARVLGAPKDSNGYTWLRQQGFTSLSKRNYYGGMRKDEAYNVLVQGYGKKNNMNLKSVRITNRNAIADISKATSTYRNNLLIGSSLNLIPLQNRKLNPNENMSIEEFMNALLVIEYKHW